MKISCFLVAEIVSFVSNGEVEGVRNFVCGHSMRSGYAPQTEKPDA